MLLVGVHGPEIPIEEVHVKHQGNSKYSVTYVARESGKYVLIVKWGEDHIPGSPFHVTVPWFLKPSFLPSLLIFTARCRRWKPDNFPPTFSFSSWDYFQDYFQNKKFQVIARVFQHHWFFLCTCVLCTLYKSLRSDRFSVLSSDHQNYFLR